MKKRIIIMDIECKAPESVFASDYADIPKQWQAIIEEAGGIPCERTGEIGPFCILPRDCVFAKWDGGWECERVGTGGLQ